MSNVIISPNMNLPVPVVGTDPAPDWANNVNSCLSAIDGHTHTAGQGVEITPGAININADLPFNNNNATTLRTCRYQSQASAPAGASDLNATTVIGTDLYYIDGAGNLVRITQGGAVSGSTGTITGLPSGTASAAFATGTFTFQSATNTPAAMNFGPVTLGQQVANGKGVTITAAGAQAANFGYTLPSALPGSNASAIVSDTSGNLTYVLLTAATDTVTGLVVSPTIYREGTTYNGVTLTVANVSNFGTITPNTDSSFIPYQTYGGAWNLRFRLEFSGNSVSNGIISIAGVTFRGSPGGIEQACAAAGVSGPAPASAYVQAGTGHIVIVATAAQTIFTVSGDVELASKPTWAN